jgi:hypothetical protein
MVYGNPAKFINWVGFSGEMLIADDGFWVSPISGEKFLEMEGGLVYEES